MFALLSFLIVAGLLLGMVAGVVWEDPDLVLAYLSGETEDVAWTTPVAKPPAPEVAAPPPERERPVDPQMRREQAAVVAEKVPAVAAAPAGSVAIQVGAFGTSRAAESLASSLRDNGYRVYVSPGTAGADARWRVRVGPLATREEAEGTAERLKKVEKLPTWILSEDAR
jgi:DedD protein